MSNYSEYSFDTLLVGEFWKLDVEVVMVYIYRLELLDRKKGAEEDERFVLPRPRKAFEATPNVE